MLRPVARYYRAIDQFNVADTPNRLASYAWLDDIDRHCKPYPKMRNVARVVQCANRCAVLALCVAHREYWTATATRLIEGA